MDVLFLTVDEVFELHRQQVEAFGGAAEVRDFGLLQSAVAMPQSGFGGAYAHEFPHEMAPAYLFHITANHPFVDGNKRTGLAAALTFLELNGHRLDADPIAVGDMVLGVASGSLDKASAVEFFRKDTRPA